MAYKRTSKSKKSTTNYTAKGKVKKKKALSEEEKKLRAIARKTYNGFVYASHEEAVCAELLDQAGLNWDYEKHTFKLMDAFYCPNNVIVHKEGKKKGKRYKVFEDARKNCEDIKYTPDFTNLDEGWIIEVKGVRTPVYVMREKLFKKYLVDNDLSYDFYAPNNKEEMIQTIEFIKLRREQKNKKVA